MKRKIIYLLILAVSTYFAWSFTKSKISQPTIGGNFNLVNQFEEQVSIDDFKDNYFKEIIEGLSQILDRVRVCQRNS